MTPAEARAFLDPAVAGRGGTWLDLGAGNGTFTRALSAILGDGGRVVAIDRDPAALDALRTLANRTGPSDRIRVVDGDVTALDRVQALKGMQCDGALLANVLHFLGDPALVLTQLASLLPDHAHVVVIEYEREAANSYVPHPLPISRLRRVAAEAGLALPDVVARRPSLWQGGMYCAVLRPAAPRIVRSAARV